ncbi:MAG TPA: transposase [Gaiellaceae bacterium]
MPRRARDTGAGLFHIYTHCVWVTRELYRRDEDRLEFLRGLARVTGKVGWTCLAYCLMTSHYHLIVDVTEGMLPKAMHSLNLPYARNFNRQYGLRGHLQFEPYGARRIVGDADLAYRFKYVANNPVEAGLCEKPGDWLWSSYAGTVGMALPATFVDPGRILRCFAWPDEDPEAALRRYVESP